MAIQYSTGGGPGGPRVNDSFTGQSAQSILNGIRTALLAAGWTEYANGRARAVFANGPSGDNPGNNNWIQIGSTVYKFYNSVVPTDGSIPIFVGSGTLAPLAYERVQTAILDFDPLFYCPFGGQFPIASALSGFTIVASGSGTNFNNAPLAVDNPNTGAWFTDTTLSVGTNVSVGGGWELESQHTPSGLGLRVRLVEETIAGQGQLANLYVTTLLEDATSQNFQLTINPVLTYRIICGPYQFFIFASESTTALESISGGVPYLQSFLQPNTITAATSTNPVTCTTINAHGLATLQTISIEEAIEVATITGMSTVPTPSLQAGNILCACANTFQQGDHVRLVTGTVLDGVYSISNVNSSQFSLDNTSVQFGTATGACYGPKHSVNGTWTVTVVDNFNFKLNGSVGSGSQPYLADSGLVAPPGSLNRAIWSVGSSASPNLRSGLNGAGASQFFALNSASYGILSNQDQANPRLVMPGLTGRPLNFSNGCAAVIEPLIAAGPNGAGTPPLVFGQLWDSAIVTTMYTLDIETTFDNHNYHLFSTQLGDSQHYQGGFFVAIS